MRENRIRTIWKAAGAVINGWLAIPSAFSAETMAHQGWDTLTVDLQHGVVDYQAAVNMFAAISTTHTVRVARVPRLDPGILMKVLEVHGDRMVKRTFDPGFRIELHQKDLNLALTNARQVGLSLPNTATAQELFNACVAHGGKA